MENELSPKQGDASKSPVVNPSVDQLKQFYPIAELSDEHLKTVARLAELKTVTRGSTIAESLSDRDAPNKAYCFFLSGSLLLDGSPCEKIERHLHLPLDLLIQGEGSLVADSDCQLVEIDKQLLDGMLCWDQVAKSLLLELASERDRDEDREWLETLLTSNLFHRIPPFNIRQILNKFAPRVVANDEMIIREGDVGDECYLIKEGSAIVSRWNETLDCEEEIARFSVGQCFGEDALVNKMRRNASVRMTSNGVLMVLKKREFLALMSEPSVFSISASRAKEVIDEGEGLWLDVRSQQEHEYNGINGSFHLPLHLMILKSRIMNRDKRYFAYCGTGKRATNAAYLLQQHGFDVVPVKEGLSQIGGQ